MKLRHLFYISSILISLCGNAQTLEEVKSWYLEGNYADALPIFREEQALKPNDASLNHWLGVSLYKTGRLLEARKYLRMAADKKIPDAFLFLGEIYAKLYRFEEAEKAFTRYGNLRKRDQDAQKRLAKAREMAATLQRAVNRTEDIQIIDSAVVAKSSFLDAIHLSASSGALLPAAAFPQALNSIWGTFYRNERNDKLYYARKTNDTGIDLFTSEKLLDRFGNEKKLPETVNGEGDQAFPFVMSDGLTLYFASTGHQSMGGFDLFVTRYNLASNSYLTPNQLNAPFNSPFNDYLMAIDEEKGVGWFVTDRYQPADSVCVYTFIPNEQFTQLESDDPACLAGRARIASIADTWKANADYTPVRNLARTKKAVQDEKEQNGFSFVINDWVTYTALSDFKSSRARDLFSQALGMEEQWQKLRLELTASRERFAAEGRGNHALNTRIRELEREEESLFRDIERLKKEAGNEENRTHYQQDTTL